MTTDVPLVLYSLPAVDEGGAVGSHVALHQYAGLGLPQVHLAFGVRTEFIGVAGQFVVAQLGVVEGSQEAVSSGPYCTKVYLPVAT
jgi:hypothetical protein